MLTLDAPVTTVVPRSTAPAPLSVPTAHYRTALAAGAVVVDLRDEAARRVHGALIGALALSLEEALEALTPNAPGALRTASFEASWLLVTDDGYDAEWLAWHLQARGVGKARFLLGGYRGLRAAGLGLADTSDAHQFFS